MFYGDVFLNQEEERKGSYRKPMAKTRQNFYRAIKTNKINLLCILYSVHVEEGATEIFITSVSGMHKEHIKPNSSSVASTRTLS